MIRPSEIEQYPEIDLKLGIKSSLPNIKSTLALLILIWEALGKPSEVLYSMEDGNKLKLSAEVKKSILEYVKPYQDKSILDKDEIENCLDSNQLLKSQIEALIVAFELVWKIAKVRFEDQQKPFSAERTGGNRYNKIITYTSNIDVLGVLFDLNREETDKIILNWLGCNIAIDLKTERDFCKILTVMSETAVYKMNNEGKDIIFNQNEIYKSLKESDSVDINGDKEAKGSLRILKSLLSEKLNPYLGYKTGNISCASDDIENLENYQKRVDAYLSLSVPKIIRSEDENNYDDVFTHNLFGIHIKQKNDALSEDNPHICIGWSNLGDLTDVDSRDKLSAIYDQKYSKNKRGRGQDIGQIWRFLHDMSIGDYVIFAESSVFHIGQIESYYYYDNTEKQNQSEDYTNNRKVKWIKKNIDRSILSANMHNSLKTAMSVWTLNDYKSVVVDLLRGTYTKDGEIDMEDEYIELIYNTKISLDYERNRIVFGAPGTGKSFGLKKDCDNLLKDTEGSYERVTFHPDYSYSQFVGTYKPVMDIDGKSIKYDFVPGPFMRVYVEALRSGRTDNPQPHLLLIEEINRAKVAAVFGDVFQLLDRDAAGVSEYEIQASEDIRRYLADKLGGNPDNYQKIRIPNNMFIWSTMNSADQGVFPMDTAFKRRWNFEYLGINENEDQISGIGKIKLAGSDEPVEWNILRRAINAKMSSEQFKINEDKLMGPFFLSKKIIASDENGMIINSDKFVDAFKSKVIMYLYEDAVKQGKHRFFDGCDSSKYSSVCDAFDKLGMGIFGSNFKENFYDEQRDEI